VVDGNGDLKSYGGITSQGYEGRAGMKMLDVSSRHKRGHSRKTRNECVKREREGYEDWVSASPRTRPSICNILTCDARVRLCEFSFQRD